MEQGGSSDSLATKTEDVLKSSTERGPALDSTLEELAFEISQASLPIKQNCVAIAVSHLKITKAKPFAASQLIAWLLLYKVVEPLQVLQTVMYTRDSGILSICGTSEFTADVIEHLHFSEAKGNVPKFKISSNEKPRVLVDLLGQRSAGARSAPKPYEPEVSAIGNEQTVSATPLKRPSSEAIDHTRLKKSHVVDHGDYELQISKLLKSSMSAEEAAHKLLGMYRKNTEDIVARSILNVCCESKIYNRFFGNLGGRLYRHNARLFGAGFAQMFTRFFLGECESLDVDPLKVSGQFIGHLLSAKALSWQAFLETASLAPEHSTPSNRILLLAVLEELKASMGISAVEKKVLSKEMATYTTGLLKTDLALGFWDLAGFPGISEAIEDDSSSEA